MEWKPEKASPMVWFIALMLLGLVLGYIAKGSPLVN